VISDSPPTEPQGELAQAAAEEEGGKKSVWKIMATPIVLVLLGIALLPVAISLYPSPTQTSDPAYARLSVLTNQRITFIDFSVVQVKPALAKIEIEVTRPVSNPSTSAPAPTTSTQAPFATLIFSPPIGISFPSCYGGCKQIHPPFLAFTWTVRLAFNAYGQAFESFVVKARSLGVSDNGLNALAVLPEVFYQGYGTPEVLVGYHIPSAANYDWSALPPAAYAGSTIAWSEPVAGEDTPPKVAVGINQSGQSSQNHLAFIAGALIGVAGGAVLSGIQEGLGRIFK
jgi:hypothetical protein